MAVRKPSLTWQLKDLRKEYAAQSQQVEALQKEIASGKQSKEYMDKRATDAERELSQIHAFLDAVPNPPADKMADGYTKIGAMTRLSVFLATRTQGA